MDAPPVASVVGNGDGLETNTYEKGSFTEELGSDAVMVRCVDHVSRNSFPNQVSRTSVRVLVPLGGCSSSSFSRRNGDGLKKRTRKTQHH